MGDKSGIAWTDATANAVVGCSRVSEGCRHCYAEQLAATRLKHTARYQGLAIVTAAGRPQWTGEARLVVDAIEQVIRWKRPRKVFLTAMGDPFHESLSFEQIAALFGLMAVCGQHTFQVLTKRPARMRAWFAWAAEQIDGSGFDGAWTPFIRALCEVLDDAKIIERIQEDGIARAAASEVWPLPNVWLGVSVESQAVANERIPELLATPAVVRFLSCEPLLERVDLTELQVVRPTGVESWDVLRREHDDDLGGDGPRIDWVIVGGESGHRARLFNVAWAYALIDQCAAAGVACFVKQLGARAIGEPRGSVPRNWITMSFPIHGVWALRDSHGGDSSEWPETLRVQQFPTEGGAR